MKTGHRIPQVYIYKLNRSPPYVYDHVASCKLPTAPNEQKGGPQNALTSRKRFGPLWNSANSECCLSRCTPQHCHFVEQYG